MLQHTLHDVGITYKLLHKCASEHNKKAWAIWQMYLRASWMASQLTFVDETSKDDHTIYHHYGCAIVESRAEVSEPFKQGK